MHKLEEKKQNGWIFSQLFIAGIWGKEGWYKGRVITQDSCSNHFYILIIHLSRWKNQNTLVLHHQTFKQEFHIFFFYKNTLCKILWQLLVNGKAILWECVYKKKTGSLSSFILMTRAENIMLFIFCDMWRKVWMWCVLCGNWHSVTVFHICFVLKLLKVINVNVISWIYSHVHFPLHNNNFGDICVELTQKSLLSATLTISFHFAGDHV